jgi:hypothetical protein
MSSKSSRETLANSFTPREVRAVLSLYQTILRGGDARQIASSAEVANVARKFQAMQRKREGFERAARGAP